MGRKFGFSKWSWKRALGISAAKARISRAIGVPLTKEGRRRKFGWLGMLLWPLAIFRPRAPRKRAAQKPIASPPASVGSVLAGLGVLTAVLVGLPLLCCGGCVALFQLQSPAAPLANSPVESSRPSVPVPPPQKRRSDSSLAVEMTSVEDKDLEPVPVPEHELREWASPSKKFTVVAQFVRYSNGTVTIRKEDGVEIGADVAKLCDKDREYIEHLRSNTLVKRGGRSTAE